MFAMSEVVAGRKQGGMSPSEDGRRGATEDVDPGKVPSNAGPDRDSLRASNSSEPLPISGLAGRTAVVTGGASGIGYGIVRRLARAGAKALVVDVDRRRLDEAERSLGREGLGFLRVEADISSPDAGRLAEELVAAHGAIPLIVNNVGICTGTGFFETDEAFFDLVFATNLRGPWFFTRRLTKELITRGESGSVLFISSLHDRFVVFRPQYAASKAAVSQLVRELAALLAPHGIRVNAISPGRIDTEQAPGREAQHLTADERIPLGRGGTPDDVAKMAEFLLSEAYAGYVTGANIPVDGGLSLHTWHSRKVPLLG
jgi:NAD(P)-dependent dehydrogenase (short-subunit alcohol dehydrogenase family)